MRNVLDHFAQRSVYGRSFPLFSFHVFRPFNTPDASLSPGMGFPMETITLACAIPLIKLNDKHFLRDIP